MPEKINATESASTWRKTAGFVLAGLAIGGGGMDIASQIMEFPKAPRAVLDISTGVLGAVVGGEVSRKRSRADVHEPYPRQEPASENQQSDV